VGRSNSSAADVGSHRIGSPWAIIALQTSVACDGPLQGGFV
jgi:hypothetical protein